MCELNDLIKKALPHLRQICFHSDGRIIAKNGKRSPSPNKLFNGHTIEEALQKMILNNKIGALGTAKVNGYSGTEKGCKLTP